MTDIELEEGQMDYNTTRPKIGAYISIGDTFIDVVWRGSIEIPLIATKESIQIVLKTRDENEKKLGSVSIPVDSFLAVNKNKTYSHWVTLFDFLEDDTYDGDLGVDDEEKPRAYVRFSVVGEISTEVTKTTTTITKTTNSSKEGLKSINKSPRRSEKTTKTTTTTNISNNSKYLNPMSETPEKYENYMTSEPVPQELPQYIQIEEPMQQMQQQDTRTMEEVYSVRTLVGDLKSDTQELVGDLKDHQNE